MKILSLFSGIGAFEKALTDLGISFEIVNFSEIDKYAIESYCAVHNIDKSKNLGDISKIKNEDLPKNVDLLTYGFPCQDISVAGNQRGIKKGTRSGLLFEAERAIKVIKPKYCIAENVKNLVGKRFKEDFDKSLKRLESYGYNNYWKVLNAKDYGVPQNRERVFIVSIRKDIDNKTFKFPKPFKMNRKIKDILLDEFDDKYFIENQRSFELLKILKQKGLLVGDKFCADSSINDPQPRLISNCITSRYNAGIQKQKQIGLVVVEKSDKLVFEQRTDEGVRTFKNDVIGTLRTIDGGGDKRVLEKKENQYKIRKLTPLECWRLMGFGDEDYWRVRKALEEKFYNGKDRSDSQMYKQAGNSIVTNVLEEIFKSLLINKEVISINLNKTESLISEVQE